MRKLNLKTLMIASLILTTKPLLASSDLEIVPSLLHSADNLNTALYIDKFMGLVDDQNILFMKTLIIEKIAAFTGQPKINMTATLIDIINNDTTTENSLKIEEAKILENKGYKGVLNGVLLSIIKSEGPHYPRSIAISEFRKHNDLNTLTKIAANAESDTTLQVLVAHELFALGEEKEQTPIYIYYQESATLKQQALSMILQAYGILPHRSTVNDTVCGIFLLIPSMKDLLIEANKLPTSLARFIGEGYLIPLINGTLRNTQPIDARTLITAAQSLQLIGEYNDGEINTDFYLYQVMAAKWLRKAYNAGNTEEKDEANRLLNAFSPEIQNASRY